MRVVPDPDRPTRNETEILRADMVSALDLLDQLVDGNLNTVTKGRVVVWKKMVRELLDTPRVPPFPGGTSDSNG